MCKCVRVCVCVCECVWVVRVNMCVCNKSVCASINISPESMEPIWGEANLPPITGDPGTARTPWALCALCRLGLLVTLLALEEDMLYTLSRSWFQRRPTRQPLSFVERFLTPQTQQGLSQWVFYKLKFNFPRMRSKIGNWEQSTTARHIGMVLIDTNTQMQSKHSIQLL